MGLSVETLVLAKKYTDEQIKNSGGGVDSADLAALKEYTDNAINKAKDDLLNGAGDAYDTFKELGELIDENKDTIKALETIATSKVDWNENDPSSVKYIENRPFGKSSEYDWVEILNNPSYSGFLNRLDYCPTFILGATYKVTFNNNDYVCICKYDQHTDCNYLGATINFQEGTFIPGQDDDIPFCLLTTNDQGSLTVRDSLPENFIIYEQQFLIHKLDEQFIPDTIARQEYIDSTFARKEDIEKLATKEQIVGKKTEGTVVTFEDKEYTCGTGAEIFNDLSTNLAIGEKSHAEGFKTVALGVDSHAEGESTQALNINSHAEGCGTIAAGDNQHAQGKYNIEDTADVYAHIVGNGQLRAPSNAHTLDWDGNAWFAGEVFIGGTGQNDTSAEKLVKESDLNNRVTPTALMLADINTGIQYKIQVVNGKLTMTEVTV